MFAGHVAGTNKAVTNGSDRFRRQRHVLLRFSTLRGDCGVASPTSLYRKCCFSHIACVYFFITSRNYNEVERAPIVI